MTDFGEPSSVLSDAVAAGAFPAAVAEVGRRDRVLWTEPFGHLSAAPGTANTTLDSVFDLASLTKVVTTTTLAMRAVDGGVPLLETPLREHFTAWRAKDRREVRVRDLLEHASGLTAHLPFFRDHHSRAEYEEAICRLPLEYEPRQRAVYSDLGFILLGFLLADTLGAPLDAQFDRLVAAHGWGEIGYRPPAGWKARTAPTETNAWRGRLLVGEVHDENAWALAGVGVNPVWQLTYLKRGSFFKPISSEKRGKSGIRPYCAVVDEVHEHRDNSVIEMLRAGTKGNQQALIFEITNSGSDRQSVCREEHEYSVKVVTGAIHNDAMFAFICSLDEDDEPFEDESCWIKANPNLGVSIQLDYIREQVEEARGLPSKESLVRRLHFCQWMDAASAWVTQTVWQKVERELVFGDFEGEDCYCGLDLSYTTDTTSLATVFPTGDDTFAALVEYWLPEDSIKEAQKRDKVPYDVWVDKGHLNLTVGKVIKLSPIAQRIGDVSDRHNLRALAYDRYRHRELADDMADLGISVPMVEHPQGFRRAGLLRDDKGDPVLDENGDEVENPLWMPDSVRLLENAVIEVRVEVAINPVLRWNVSSVIVRDDPAGTENRVFDKRKSTGRIDGLVALAMATGAAFRVGALDNGPSVYETGDFFI